MTDKEYSEKDDPVSAIKTHLGDATDDLQSVDDLVDSELKDELEEVDGSLGGDSNTVTSDGDISGDSVTSYGSSASSNPTTDDPTRSVVSDTDDNPDQKEDSEADKTVSL